MDGSNADDERHAARKKRLQELLARVAGIVEVAKERVEQSNIKILQLSGSAQQGGLDGDEGSTVKVAAAIRIARPAAVGHGQPSPPTPAAGQAAAASKEVVVQAEPRSSSVVACSAGPPAPPPPPPHAAVLRSNASTPAVHAAACAPRVSSSSARAPPPPPPPSPASSLRTACSSLPALPLPTNAHEAKQVGPVKQLTATIGQQSGRAAAKMAPPPPSPPPSARAATAARPLPHVPSPPPPPPPASALRALVGTPPVVPADVAVSATGSPPDSSHACLHSANGRTAPAPAPPPPPPPPHTGLHRLSRQGSAATDASHETTTATAAVAQGGTAAQPRVPPLQLAKCVRQEHVSRLVCGLGEQQRKCDSDISNGARTATVSNEADALQSTSERSSSGTASATSSNHSSPRGHLPDQQPSHPVALSEPSTPHKLSSASGIQVLASATCTPAGRITNPTPPHRPGSSPSMQALASAASMPVGRFASACAGAGSAEAAARQLRRTSSSAARDRRTLHWEAVKKAPQQLEGTVWGHVTDDPAPNEGVIDQLFSREVPDGTLSPRRGSLDGAASPRNQQSPIDIKRATAVEVVLKRFALTPATVVASIEGLHASPLSVEALQALRQIMPTSAETALIQSHYAKGGKGQQLSQVDEFFLAMSNVKWLAEKTRAMELRHTLKETEAVVTEFSMNVNTAMEQLMQSGRLRMLFGAVRSAGNAVNSHRPHAQVAGVKISALRRLKDTKSYALNDTCLLHYLVAHVEREMPLALDAASELTALRGKCNMDFGMAQGKLRELAAAKATVLEDLVALRTASERASAGTGGRRAGAVGKAVVAAPSVAALFAKRAAAGGAGAAASKAPSGRSYLASPNSSTGASAGKMAADDGAVAPQPPLAGGAEGSGGVPRASTGTTSPAANDAGPDAQAYLASLARLVDESTPVVAALEAEVATAMQRFRWLAKYFCEDVSKGFEQQPLTLFQEVTDFLDDVCRARSERRKVDQVHELMEEQESQDIDALLDQQQEDGSQDLSDCDDMSDVNELELPDIEAILGEEDTGQAAEVDLGSEQAGLYVQPCSLLGSFESEAACSAVSPAASLDAAPRSDGRSSANGVAGLLGCA